MNANAKSTLRRALSALLCLAMLAGLAVPVFAEDTLSNGAVMLTNDSDDNVVLNKSATLTDDGTYTIDLSAYATGDSVTKEVNMVAPMDIILVLDSSGSMVGSKNNSVFDNTRAKALYTAAKQFVEEINADAVAHDAITPETEHRLAVVTFGGADSGNGTVWKWGGVNGQKDYFCNTGMFVNGEFKNYAVKDSTKTVDYYEPVWDLDTTQTYVCFAGNDTGDGFIRTQTYSNGTWKDGSSTPKVPMSVPYESSAKRQFMEVTEKLAADILINENDYKNALMGIVTEKDEAYAAVNKIVAKGSTYTEYGMEMALNILKANPPRTYVNPLTGKTEEAKQMVILFTDGNTDSKKATVGSYADQIKALGASIYSIGVGDLDADNEEFLQKLSSNYASYDSASATESNYYFSATETSKILEFFEDISGNVTSSSTTVPLDETSTMRDYMNDGFVLPEGFNASANVELSVQEVSTTDDENYSFGTEHPCTLSADNTYTVTVNGETITMNLSFDMEENYVGVQGFDYSKFYAAKSHDGLMLKVKIKGIQLTADAKLDEVVSTNKENSGIGAVIDGEFIPVYKFPRPLTKAVSVTYVMDYAKSIDLYPCTWFTEINGMGTAPTIIPITEDGSVTVDTDYGTFVGSRVDEHDDALADHEHLNVKFTPKTMQWNAPASLFLFGKYSEAAVLAEDEETVTTGYNMWGKVSVIPANNIYYEDDFESTTQAQGGRVGIVYTGTWTEDGSKQDGTTENHEGEENDTNGGVHGWEDNLADDTGYSDGSAHKADAEADSSAKATFTFTGTGVDIYSRTNNGTGTVIATLKGTTNSGVSVSKGIVMDNKSASGDYYQIPTLSFNSYKVNGEEVALPYGTYTVTIKVTTGADDNGDRVCDRFLYYLDGIRVYNPMQDQSGYAPEEQNAIFKEVRDILIDANSFDSDGENTGVVFIDELTAEQAPEGTEDGTPTTTTNVIGVYEDYGPKNEVYLKSGQAITFCVEELDGQYFYVGLKAPNINGSEVGYSGTTTATVSFGKNSDNENVNKDIAVTHSTDMYYEVKADEKGFITIQNTGDGLLSVTKLRTTGTAGDVQILSITEEEALDAVAAFSLRPAVKDEEEPVDPETPTEPETPDVEIENPTEPEKPTKPVISIVLQSQLKKMLQKLFDSLNGWFH